MKTIKKKLIVMIPCYNEEKTLPLVIKSIPKEIPGISMVETLVIDDGSTDKSAKIAKRLKATVVSHHHNEGLGIAFQTGIKTALKMGADLIVNIDADMQFNPRDIPKLVRPIQNGEADMVTASRFKDPNLIPKNMPRLKKWGNHWFTNLMNILTRRKFTDTQCGYRAYSKEAALRMTLFGKFTYTQEVFLDLINKGIRIVEIPSRVKYRKGREAKISRSLSLYALRALLIILRTFRDYKPLVFFGLPGVIMFGIGNIFLIISAGYWILEHQTTPVRMALFTGAFLSVFGLLLIVLALVADMLKRIRRNQEELLYQSRIRNYKE